jgi:hypothetical protein
LTSGILTFMAALVLVAAPAHGDTADTPAVVSGKDAAVASASSPSAGRSLFDFIVSTTESGKSVQRVPFPFAALLERIGRQLEGGQAKGIRTVLIPLGRSLQRNAPAEEFFRYPRVVAAVVGETRPGPRSAAMLLKDRLYIGYQEKAGVLEVISYNELAGRFEFQIVKDYREGGRPKVFYANREMCLACHQNQAPIFSRQTWDETDANPFVAAQLAEARSDFYGIVPGRNVDIPNAIDDATERANLLSVAQSLWRLGCEVEGKPEASVRCRARAFLAALRFRLSGDRRVDLQGPQTREELLEPLRASWQAHWPAGLPIPNPDILNRDPFALLSEADRERLEERSLLRAAEVSAAFDPLLLRKPLEVWNGNDAERFVKALAQFIAAADVQELDRFLRRDAAGYARLERAVAELEQDNLAGSNDAFSAAPFRRAAVMKSLFARLGLPVRDWCCLDPGRMAAPAADDSPLRPGAEHGSLLPFYRACATCHESRESFPPGFLYGSGMRATSNIDACAERILFRLAMWSMPESARAKTPMPPAAASHAHGFERSPELRAMRAYLEQRTGKPADERALVSRRYEQLPRCVPVFD